MKVLKRGSESVEKGTGQGGEDGEGMDYAEARGRRKQDWSEPLHPTFPALNLRLALQTSFMVGVTSNARATT